MHKIAKVTVGFIMSVCISVHKAQLSYQLMYFLKISY